jgi:predicted flap endonuclease-1-like 5' DNA nuclease/uncharacterized membrane-anchored protein YhcB (DUF1043 family)
MYLLSQVWWYLILAFLLGALIGYVLWRLCSSPMLESRFERSRQDMASRLSMLEDERTGVSKAGDGEAAKLRAELAASASQVVGLQTAAAETQSLLAAQHSDAIRKAREEVTAALTAAHASELKKIQDTAKAQETKVLALIQADASARQELEAAKARHTDDLKKAREQVATEWAAKHAAEIKKVRDEAAAEAARTHQITLDKAKADQAVAASSSQDGAMKAARDAAVAEATLRHREELAKLKADHAADIARYSDQIAKARATAVAAPSAMSPAAFATATTNSTAPSTADDLKLIWGVGPAIEKFLHEHGVRRFDQIAHWSEKDLVWLDTALPAFKGRARDEKWIAQCQRLSTGWRPERAVGEKPDDILKAPRGGKADDLKLIWGVGPKLESVLNAAGFYHFDQIAKWTEREIEWVDTQLGDFAGRAVRDKWVEQCGKLASGWRPGSEVGERPR